MKKRNDDKINEKKNKNVAIDVTILSLPSMSSYCSYSNNFTMLLSQKPTLLCIRLLRKRKCECILFRVTFQLKKKRN